MTADTTALQERIARAAATSEGFGPDHPDHEFVVGEYLSDAQFLAPFIAAEVRKAQGEALRETADWWAANPDDDAFETPGDTRNWLRDVATEYEIGDRA